MEIDIEHAVFVIADLGNLVVAQGVGMAIGCDAPDVERAQFAIAIDGNHDGGEAAALRTKDLDDTALQERGFAVRLDGEGLFVIEHDRHGGLGIIGRGGMCGGEYPVGRLGCAGHGRQRPSAMRAEGRADRPRVAHPGYITGLDVPRRQGAGQPARGPCC